MGQPPANPAATNRDGGGGVADVGSAVPRPIKTRRIRFRYSDDRLARHYVTGGPYTGGDLVMSHIVAVLSAVFPEGEDFFVRSVRNSAGDVTDPELAQQVKGFIGQEVTHGREHRDLNDQLQKMGYPTHRIDRYTKATLERLERLTPRLYPLAVTAALEHYTATLAETLLSDERARELLGDNEVRSILLWHALEESEHKAVAFDVYRAAGGSERMRKTAMVITSITFIGNVTVNTILSMLADRATYNPVRLLKSLWMLRRSPFITRQVRRSLVEYLRTGFHPSDHDNTALLDEWTPKLFGDHGTLVDRLT
jgi:predicted metal-dependent hydrolase